MKWNITISTHTLISVYRCAIELQSSEDLLPQFARTCDSSLEIEQTEAYLVFKSKKEALSTHLQNLDYDSLLDIDALNYIGMGLFKNLDESKQYCERRALSDENRGKSYIITDILSTPCLGKNLYAAFQSRAGNPLDGI